MCLKRTVVTGTKCTSILSVRGAGLEQDFDDYDEKHRARREFGSEWRSSALSSTLGEVPRIRLTGRETGPCTGLGETIYLEQQQLSSSFDDAFSADAADDALGETQLSSRPKSAACQRRLSLSLSLSLWAAALSSERASARARACHRERSNRRVSRNRTPDAKTRASYWRA